MVDEPFPLDSMRKGVKMISSEICESRTCQDKTPVSLVVVAICNRTYTISLQSHYLLAPYMDLPFSSKELETQFFRPGDMTPVIHWQMWTSLIQLKCIIRCRCVNRGTCWLTTTIFTMKCNVRCKIYWLIGREVLALDGAVI